MNRYNRLRAGMLVGALLLMGSTAGCSDLLGAISGKYSGPRPAREGLIAETAIIRRVTQTDSGQIARLLLDRVRYLESGDEHSVNRIIEVATGRAQSQVDALDLKPSDRVIVSTEFFLITTKGELTEVPEWPGHGYDAYPIGLHNLTSVTRAAP